MLINLWFFYLFKVISRLQYFFSKKKKANTNTFTITRRLCLHLLWKRCILFGGTIFRFKLARFVQCRELAMSLPRNHNLLVWGKSLLMGYGDPQNMLSTFSPTMIYPWFETFKHHISLFLVDLVSHCYAFDDKETNKKTTCLMINMPTIN